MKHTPNYGSALVTVMASQIHLVVKASDIVQREKREISKSAVFKIPSNLIVASDLLMKVLGSFSHVVAADSHSSSSPSTVAMTMKRSDVGIRHNIMK